eukprot:COSAG02_NODE_42139_length_387_cov_0.954861_1_plen_43_part_10
MLFVGPVVQLAAREIQLGSDAEPPFSTKSVMNSNMTWVKMRIS